MTVVQIKSPEIIDKNTSPDKILSILMANRPKVVLQPSYPQFTLNLTSAVKLIKDAIKNNKNILIYGDYDVDGLTSTALLWQAIHQIYPRVYPFIPHRQKDGYGFKAKSFFNYQQVKKIQIDLLITLDNGIVAESEFNKIKAKQEIKIIVVDHHQTNGELTSIDALIHSIQVSASVLSWFLSKKFNSQADLGLAALGAVADCLPLTGINRSIVFHGLQSLHLHPNLGLKKICQINRIDYRQLTVYDLGFIISPRLNAAGRLADPVIALRLLCSQNLNQATQFASQLHQLNQDRQILQKQSIELVQKSVNLKHQLIFIYQSEFNPGIIGLIAGRLSEDNHLPSVIISDDGDIAKGSCRSIPGVNIINLLRQDSDLFIDLGGHEGAAGFSIKKSNIPLLKSHLFKSFDNLLKNYQPQNIITVDAQMKLSAVNLTIIKTIQQLQPFGIGNPEPLFIIKNLTIISKRLLGQNQDHLKLKLDDPSTKFPENYPADGIAFKQGKLDSNLNVGDVIDIIATLSSNTWNGQTSPQMIIKDIIKAS